MSLYEAADGLLGTHVTWHDVEQEMQKSLKTKAVFGENKTATNISLFKGFFSCIALINPDWENVCETEREKLPGKFVVKISSQMALVEMGKHMKGENPFDAEKLKENSEVTRIMHNREVDVYKLLAEQNDPNIPITKVYASKKFDETNTLKAYLISDYVEDVHSVGLHESISWQDLIPALKSIAAFSAIGEKVSRDRFAFIKGPHILDLAFANFTDKKMFSKAIERLREAFSEEYREKMDQFEKINTEFYMRSETVQKYKEIPDIFDYKTVLVHSDLWGPNILYTKNGDHLTLKAIIDWQTVLISSPGQELARLFLSTLTRNDRREHVEELMEIYYNTFIEHLEGRPAPYTLENLKASYNLYAPLITMMVLPGIEPMLKQFGGSDTAQQTAKDKMIGLLEDFISAHERNLVLYPQFFA